MSAQADRDEGSRRGVFNSLRAVMASFTGLLQTRLDLAATEIEEERERLKELIVLGAVALFCASLAALLITVLIVVLYWETHRLAVLGGLALFYLAAGAAALLIMRRRAARRPKLFAATFAELSKDKERLES